MYIAADAFARLTSFVPPLRAVFLAAVPNVAQGIFAALSDFYTWKLAEKVFGQNSNTAWSTVLQLPPLACLGTDEIRAALDDRSQPLAVVLLNQDLLQLSRDDAHRHGSLLLAMGASGRRERSEAW